MSVPARDPGERFWGLVDKTTTPDGCWTWTGGTYRRGYGRFSLPGGKSITATRFALQLALGRPLTAEEIACHGCDHPPCVRVGDGHLFVGSLSDNTQDMVTKGRHVAPNLTGSTNPNARLTEERVRTIRAAHATGNVSVAGLAHLYGVSTRCILYVVNRITWRHLGDEPTTERA